MRAVNRHRVSLLVVDDNADNRELLTRYFGERGFQVAEADCGLTALSMIKRQHFDAVLLDVIMPGIDGIEVLKRIRASPTQADLPVFIVSGKSAHNDIKLALELGANDYVTKPVDLAATLAKLQHVLGVLPDKQTNPQAPEKPLGEPVQSTAPRSERQIDPACAEQPTGKDAQNDRAVAENFRPRKELRRKARRQLQCTAWILLDKKLPAIKCTITDLSAFGTGIVLQNDQDLPNDFVLLLTEDGSAWFNCHLIWRTGLKAGVEFTSGLTETKERPQIGALIDVTL